jgi:hypothetical protein
MIKRHIDERGGIQPVHRPEILFGPDCSRVCIRKIIDRPVQDDPFLDPWRKIKLLFPFYKIADNISHQNFR